MLRYASSGIRLVLLPALLAAFGPGRAVAAEVSFIKDVQPFLNKYCVECHTKDKPHGGVALDSYKALIQGNDPVVRPNKPERSDLVKVLTAGRGVKFMPPQKATRKPTAEEIAMIRAWVLAGAADDTDPGKKSGMCQPAEEPLSEAGLLWNPVRHPRAGLPAGRRRALAWSTFRSLVG
jgi:hypothetical protein